MVEDLEKIIDKLRKRPAEHELEAIDQVLAALFARAESDRKVSDLTLSKLYQAAAMLKYYQDDFSESRRLIEASVEKRGTIYDLAQNMLNLLDLRDKQQYGTDYFGLDSKRITLLVLASIGAFCTFMPWVTALGIGVNGTKGDGWISFGVLLIPIAVIGLSKVSRIAYKASSWVSGLAGLACVVLGVWKIIDFNKVLSGTPQDELGIGRALSSTADIGFGLYLLVIVSLLLIGTAILANDRFKRSGPIKVRNVI